MDSGRQEDHSRRPRLRRLGGHDPLDLELRELDAQGAEIGRSKGELLLPAQAFFDMQLPSFKADTDDPARQMWAMATFGRFFFGQLVADLPTRSSIASVDLLRTS